jgi:hypothetical protein
MRGEREGGDWQPGDVAVDGGRSLHPSPARNRRPNESEVGALIVEEAKVNVGKEDAMQPIARLNSYPLAFECVADGDHGAS